MAIFAREKGSLGTAADRLTKIEGITEVLMVTGKDDIVAMAEVLSEGELKWLRDQLQSEPSIDSFEIGVVTAEKRR